MFQFSVLKILAKSGSFPFKPAVRHSESLSRCHYTVNHYVKIWHLRDLIHINWHVSI